MFYFSSSNIGLAPDEFARYYENCAFSVSFRRRRWKTKKVILACCLFNIFLWCFFCLKKDMIKKLISTISFNSRSLKMLQSFFSFCSQKRHIVTKYVMWRKCSSLHQNAIITMKPECWIKRGQTCGNKFTRTLMAYYWQISMEIRQWLSRMAHTPLPSARAEPPKRER